MSTPSTAQIRNAEYVSTWLEACILSSSDKQVGHAQVRVHNAHVVHVGGPLDEMPHIFARHPKRQHTSMVFPLVKQRRIHHIKDHVQIGLFLDNSIEVVQQAHDVGVSVVLQSQVKSQLPNGGVEWQILPFYCNRRPGMVVDRDVHLAEGAAGQSTPASPLIHATIAGLTAELRHGRSLARSRRRVREGGPERPHAS